MPDLTDLNPAFASRLDAFKAALDKAGIGYDVISGYRSPEQQAGLYADYQAGRRSLPAAPPWRSFHNFGLAADVTPKNSADYQRMWDIAAQSGLTPLRGTDPPHVQMAGALSDLIKQYNLAGWRPPGEPAPAEGAAPFAAPPAGSPPAALAARANPSGYAYFGLNNPGNIGFSGWTQAHGGSTSSATDTGHKIASFPDLASGYAAMGDLALNKYRGGATSLNQLIAGKSGWTPGNTAAAANIAKTMGVSPDADLGLTDPAKLKAFQRALTLQETGSTRQFETAFGGAPGTTINAAGGPAPGSTAAAAGGPSSIPATGGPATGSGGLAANLPGFTPDSPGARMTAAGLQQLAGGGPAGGGGGGQGEQPAAPPLQPERPAQAMGGPMMMAPGGQNTAARMAAQQWLQAQGFRVAPSLADYGLGGIKPAVASGLPGMTLNSPSQWQMALMGYDPSQG